MLSVFAVYLHAQPGWAVHVWMCLGRYIVSTKHNVCIIIHGRTACCCSIVKRILENVLLRLHNGRTTQ